MQPTTYRMLWRTHLVCTVLHSQTSLSRHLLRPAASSCLRSAGASRICRRYKACTKHSSALTDSDRRGIDSPSTPSTIFKFADSAEEEQRNHILPTHSSSYQPVSWSRTVDYSRLRHLYCNPLQAALSRHFSISAASFEKGTGVWMHVCGWS